MNEQIKIVQREISNIRSEVGEAERLMRVREQLYFDLDRLRSEREEIEAQIEGSVVHYQTETIKYSGYREMNERLRRRIAEVNEYINKMTL